jgi:hypothetical protein
MVAGLLLVAACGTADELASGADDCPEVAERGSVHIDWVDFVKIGDRSYHLAHVPSDRQQLDPEQVGERIAETRCQLPNDFDQDYQPQDGDASFLEPGTPLFAVEGFDPGFRLATEDADGVTLYEVDRVPGAERGADILADIAGKVTAININSEQDGVTTMGRISDPEQVASLVELVLEAPVDHDATFTRGVGPHVEFVLEATPPVTLVLYADHNILGSHDLRVPDEFVIEIRRAAQEG